MRCMEPSLWTEPKSFTFQGKPELKSFEMLLLLSSVSHARQICIKITEVIVLTQFLNVRVHRTLGRYFRLNVSLSNLECSSKGNDGRVPHAPDHSKPTWHFDSYLAGRTHTGQTSKKFEVIFSLLAHLEKQKITARSTVRPHTPHIDPKASKNESLDVRIHNKYMCTPYS